MKLLSYYYYTLLYYIILLVCSEFTRMRARPLGTVPRQISLLGHPLLPHFGPHTRVKGTVKES